MKIETIRVKVKDLIKDFTNGNDVSAVTGYSNKLDIRPIYQRNFRYNEKQQKAVIHTILKGFPLGIMYWCKNKSQNGTEHYEVLDGQQRTISICEFCTNDNYSIPIDGKETYFSNLSKADQDKILNYELMIFVCEGSDSERLEWFKTINIAGAVLTSQELRNANYAGSWLACARPLFSKKNGFAYNLGSKFIQGDVDKQEILETAIEWIAEYGTHYVDEDGENINISYSGIDNYMACHQNDPNCDELKLHFSKVIEWVNTKFPKYRKEMKRVNWGHLYALYGNRNLDASKLEIEIQKLMADDDVTKKSGVYEYILSKNEKFLNIRQFTETQKRTVYEKQKGICAICGKHFEFEEMEGDHIIPWSKGGHTTLDNCQMCCKHCNNKKSNS